jgi:hypothetical protein
VTTIIDLDTFLTERVRYLVGAAAGLASSADLGAARVHFETTDNWPSLSGCRE